MDLLLVLKGPDPQRVLWLSGDGLTVGRSPENELCLADSGVSREHLRILRRSEGWMVQDLGSRNGLLVNGELTRKAELQWGDRVSLGDHTLVFLPQALEAGTEEAEAALRSGVASEQLSHLFHLSARFASLVDQSELLGRMLDCLIEVFRAERGFVLLKDPRTGRLAEAISRHMEGDQDVRISRTIAHDVAARGKALLLTDALADGTYGAVESIEREQIRSVICSPLLGKRSVLGVVYLDSRVGAKTFSQDELQLLDAFSEHAANLIASAQERSDLRRSVDRLRRLHVDELRREHDYQHVIGTSPAFTDVLARVRDLAASDVTTLLTGESGTGKELVAKAIHYASERSEAPFVPVNCMALSSGTLESELFGHEKGAFTGAAGRKIGRFEVADGGTLFLDEVGELSHEVQVKLLRVLQERSFERVGGTEPIAVDVRLIAATNRDLGDAVADGSFREDLYYRIDVFHLHLPPLRERREDVPPLVEHFIACFNERLGRAIRGIEDEALAVLMDYPWPGNVRELRNVIERAFVLERGARIAPSSLPLETLTSRRCAARFDGMDGGIEPRDFNGAKAAFERRFLCEALRRHEGQIAATARELGLPRKTIYRKMELYGIDPKTFS